MTRHNLCLACMRMVVPSPRRFAKATKVLVDTAYSLLEIFPVPVIRSVAVRLVSFLTVGCVNMTGA
jgi:hypothetical protein